MHSIIARMVLYSYLYSSAVKGRHTFSATTFFNVRRTTELGCLIRFPVSSPVILNHSYHVGICSCHLKDVHKHWLWFPIEITEYFPQIEKFLYSVDLVHLWEFQFRVSQTLKIPDFAGNRCQRKLHQSNTNATSIDANCDEPADELRRG